MNPNFDSLEHHLDGLQLLHVAHLDPQLHMEHELDLPLTPTMVNQINCIASKRNGQFEWISVSLMKTLQICTVTRWPHEIKHNQALYFNPLSLNQRTITEIKLR